MTRAALALIALAACDSATDEPPVGPGAELHGVVITRRDVIVDGAVFAVAPSELEARLAERLLAQGAHVPLAYTPDASAELILSAWRGIAAVPHRDIAIVALDGLGAGVEVCRPVLPPPADDRLVLALRALPGQVERSVLGTNDSRVMGFARLDEAVVLLRDELVPDRTDALLAAGPGAHGADLTHAIAALCRGGFTAIRPVADLAALERPTVAVGQPSAQGDLPKADIRREIRRNLPPIRACYQRALVDKPGLSGTLMIQFFIAPTGQVATANSSGVDPAVARCVADAIKQIEFPRPKGGGGVQVNYPFTFRRGAPP